MNNSKISCQKNEGVAWGLLAVLWGATILFDFIPFGAGLIGTGLIFLGANVIRLINHLPMRSDNTLLGVLILAWGGLELVRPYLHQLFPSSDLDWVIFAILLISFGVILLARTLFRARESDFGTAYKEK